MKFKTLKTSKTGEKFTKVQEKMTDARIKTFDFIESIGAESFAPGFGCVASGISSMQYPKGYDVPNYMKRVGYGHYPKMNMKAGIELEKQIEKLPRVKVDELNNCIGYKSKHWNCIGFDATNDKYYVFSVNEEWEIGIPDDCDEITITEYRKLCPKKK